MDLSSCWVVQKTSLVEKTGFRENGEARNGDAKKAQIVFAIRQEFVCS